MKISGHTEENFYQQVNGLHSQQIAKLFKDADTRIAFRAVDTTPNHMQGTAIVTIAACAGHG
jgi:hypothetical protein